MEEICTECQLLPLIKESCLSSDEQVDVETTLKYYFGVDCVRTLLLYKYSSAARFNGELYGTRNSFHSSSSLVLARKSSTTTDIIPGFVMKYIVVDVILRFNGVQTQEKVYLAIIHWLSEYEHRQWFCHPVEVWHVLSPCVGSSCFIPVSNILCRCAHLTETSLAGYLRKMLPLLYHSIILEVFSNYCLPYCHVQFYCKPLYNWP